MTDRDSLIRAICENPSANTPRLVFADWCREHGETDRADFIQAMIELDGLNNCLKPNKFGPYYCGSCHPCRLRIKSERLMLKIDHSNGLSGKDGDPHGYGYAIKETDASFSHAKGIGFALWRGFPEELHIDCDTFMFYARRIFERLPITKVVLVDKQAYNVSPARMRPINDKDDFGWCRFVVIVTHRSCHAQHLPMDLFSLLPSDLKVRESTEFVDDHPECKGFPNRVVADRFLSDACVSYGRQLAGLPPLNHTQTAQ